MLREREGRKFSSWEEKRENRIMRKGSA